MNQVLTKILATQFYKINAGFFLASFILLFGLLNGQATIELHYQIMRSITSSFSFMAGAMIVWVLYNIKCLSYGLKTIHAPENSFLYEIRAVNNNRQKLLWIANHIMLLAPMLTYAGITIVVGITNRHYLHTSLFLLFQLLLCSSGLIYFQAINSSHKQPRYNITLPKTNFRKGLFSFLLLYSLDTKKTTFIGIKLLSLLLLQGLIAANAYEVNRESVCVLIIFLISAHALLPIYYVTFMEEELAFMRNLPIPALKKFASYVFTYAIIFLPELLFLLINGNHALPLSVTLSLYGVAMSQLALYTSIQYLREMTTERYTMIVFVFFFASILFLASFDLWPLFVVELIAASIIYLIQYKKYEKQNGS
jgi:hypothetical protein